MKNKCSKSVIARCNGHHDSLSWIWVYQRREGSQQNTKCKNTRFEGSLLTRTCRTQSCKQAELLSLQPSSRGHQPQLWSLHRLIFRLVPHCLKETKRTVHFHLQARHEGNVGVSVLVEKDSGFSSCADENHGTISDIIPSVESQLALNEVHPWLPALPDQSQRASSNQEAPLLSVR